VKKYWVRVLGTFGALLTIQSVLWEYARMRPDYGFLVEPWSIRGYETVHGAIAVSAGVLALVSFLLVSWKQAERPLIGAAISAFIALGATAIAFAFGGGDYTLTPGFPVISVLTLILGMASYRTIGSFAKNTTLMTNAWLRTLLLLVLLGAFAIALERSIGGQEMSMPQWLAIAVIFFLLAALSIASEPRELSANRMLMFSSVVGAAALALSAGAVRSTLVRLQAEAGGIPSQYRDTQVTSGHLLAVIGIVLVFFAAVALWARRRDAILTAARAAKQREAAEASAAEIEAALQHVSQHA
jgi:hypothetical protein